MKKNKAQKYLAFFWIIMLVLTVRLFENCAPIKYEVYFDLADILISLIALGTVTWQFIKIDRYYNCVVSRIFSFTIPIIGIFVAVIEYYNGKELWKVSTYLSVYSAFTGVASACLWKYYDGQQKR